LSVSVLHPAYNRVFKKEKGVANMSMDQIRAQRAYLDATDLEREASVNIDRLEGELERWRQIKRNAETLGAAALAETTGEAAPESDSNPE
jgi:hypothetical protein